MSYTGKIKLVRGISLLNAGSLIVFGGISLMMTLPPPLTVDFGVSIAVLMHGGIEWKYSRRLSNGEFCVLAKMALNQLLLAGSISIYAVWKLIFFDKESLFEILETPWIKSYLSLLSAEDQQMLTEFLPWMIQLIYVLIIPVVWLGCGGLAWYYWAKKKSVGLQK